MQIDHKKSNNNDSVSNDAPKDRYAVFRNGARVSDEEYANRGDAQSEYDHWTHVITRWPDNSKLEIVNLVKKG